MTLRVVLADDEHLVRAGIRTVLERDPQIQVVGEAGDGAEAVSVVRALQPDVALLDVRMPLLDGIEATARLAADPEVTAQLVVLTTFDDDALLDRALRAGALGYLLKSMPARQLVAAVHTAAAGDVLVAPALLRRLLDERRAQHVHVDAMTDLRTRLSPRELDVLLLLAKGLSNDEIAAQLVLSPATVKTHVGAMLLKLAVRDRLQLVVLAFQQGLVEPGR